MSSSVEFTSALLRKLGITPTGFSIDQQRNTITIKGPCSIKGCEVLCVAKIMFLLGQPTILDGGDCPEDPNCLLRRKGAIE